MKSLDNLSTGEIIKQILRVANDKRKRDSVIHAAIKISQLLDYSGSNDPQSKEAQKIIQCCRSIRDVLLADL